MACYLKENGKVVEINKASLSWPNFYGLLSDNNISSHNNSLLFYNISIYKNKKIFQVSNVGVENIIPVTKIICVESKIRRN